MISNLNTPFRWYDDIDYQNRYKGYCQSVCDFKLITPNNKLLPFVIRTNLEFSGDIIEIFVAKTWKIYCSDGTLYIDLVAYLGQISVTLIGGVYYIIYSGTSVISELECGSYYSVVEIWNSGLTTNTFYSEIFNVVEFADSTPASDTSLPIFTAWRFYDDINKQTRFQGKCQAACDYYLIAPDNTLPPFMIKIPTGGTVTRFRLVGINDDCEHEIDPAIINKHTQDVGDFDDSGVIDFLDLIAFLAAGNTLYDLFYYTGEEIENMPCGKFYAVVTIGEVEYFSEPVHIIGEEFPGNNGLLTDSGIQILTDSGLFLEVD